MFKKTDPDPQLDIFTAPSMLLGSRASKKYSDPNSWHNQFYSLVTTKIDEEIFKPLFPEGKKSDRPNASIRILVAMSVLKEGFGCSDEDLFEKCEFDLLTRKALGMELLTDVTPSIDTYYLFRRRICEYQERTGIDKAFREKVWLCFNEENNSVEGQRHKNRLTPFGISLSCSLAYYFYSSPLSSSSVFSGISSNGNCLLIAALNEMMVSLRDKPNGCNLSWMISNKWWLLLA